ncbi:MAG: helix-hairpin-helix domain-containing protein [Ignavibacteriales bacterium]|nr:helix-hairpin-helix domain-containing protein [Ignavibacteriales bacterium]
MKLIQQLFQKIGFSKNERLVVFFLLITFVLGGIVKIFFVSVTLQPTESYDFSSVEEEFDSLSNSSSPMTMDLLKPNVPLKNASINVNTATAKELEQLPGVGASVAERIIAYRLENNRFSSLEELKEIKGIGEKKFEKIKQFVTLGN